jgi:hypothetical protein
MDNTEKHIECFGPLAGLSKEIYVILPRLPDSQSVKLSFTNDSYVARLYNICVVPPTEKFDVSGVNCDAKSVRFGEDGEFLLSFRLKRPEGIQERGLTEMAEFKKLKVFMRTWNWCRETCKFCLYWCDVERYCKYCNSVVRGQMVVVNIAFPDKIEYGCGLFYTIIG